MASDALRKDGSMKAERRLQPVKDASHLYEVERRDRHAERPGFRISELQLSPTQTVPWHFHTNISDTFYVLEGEMRLFLQDPKEEVNLKPGEVYVVNLGGSLSKIAAVACTYDIAPTSLEAAETPAVSSVLTTVGITHRTSTPVSRSSARTASLRPTTACLVPE